MSIGEISENELEDEIVERIRYDSFKQGSVYTHLENISVPIDYIPDYIKRTSVYQEMYETINDDRTMLIPVNKLPFPSIDKIIPTIDFLLIMDYWDVDPNFIFDTFGIKKIIDCFSNYFLSNKLLENNYVDEVYKLIPFKIESKYMLYYFIHHC